MQHRWSNLVCAVDNRTGLLTACRTFLLEEIPASAGWPHVFGSVAAFLFLTQALTGILLASDFAPVPGDAHRSLTYILKRVAGGPVIWGLHHWGASFLIVVIFLHMAQVFIYGAYRKPREATWMAGICLLLVTLAFGLTGYLLPWDNRAYWGTVVTTRIAASIPVLGRWLLHLIGAENGIGVLTFSRFYSLHTLILPLASLGLILFHIYLVRRHGITPELREERPRENFYPKQVFRDVIAIFVTFLVLFCTAAFAHVPLERMADPTDITYIPRPEWYFLFLFQLLKLLPGTLEFLGSVVLPGLAVLCLLALPFIETSRLRVFNRRAAAAGAVMLVFAVWAGLTTAGVVSSGPRQNAGNVSPEALEWGQLAPEEIAGMGYFHSSGCDSCHNLLQGTPKPGPNLMAARSHQPKEWLIQHFNKMTVENNRGTAHKLSLPELNALLLFVATLNPDSMELLSSMKPSFVAGAQVYVAGGCSSCHRINGSGGGVGPPLNGLFRRRSREWIINHFAMPQRLSPGSIMPAYRFTSEQQEALLTYLSSLPD